MLFHDQKIMKVLRFGKIQKDLERFRLYPTFYYYKTLAKTRCFRNLKDFGKRFGNIQKNSRRFRKIQEIHNEILCDTVELLNSQYNMTLRNDVYRGGFKEFLKEF